MKGSEIKPEIFEYAYKLHANLYTSVAKQQFGPT